MCTASHFLPIIVFITSICSLRVLFCCITILIILLRAVLFKKVLVKATDQGPKAPRSLGGHIRHIDSKAYHEVCKHMNKMSESMLQVLRVFFQNIWCQKYYAKFGHTDKCYNKWKYYSIMQSFTPQASLLGCNCSNKRKDLLPMQ